MKTLTHLLMSFALLSSAACIPDADADSASSALAGGGGGGQRPPRPPQEALDACVELAAGDACEFDHDGHHVTGTCFTPDEDHPLACKPDQPPPPPPEAFEMCDGADAGDPCDVGTCQAGPDGQLPLACVP